MNKKSVIYIAGHSGLVGSNLLKRLEAEGYKGIYHPPRFTYDLTRQDQVESFFDLVKPEYVFICAAHVGGILENDTHSADIIYNNTMIQSNIIKASHDYKVKKLMYLGSSCIYPNTIHRPISENDLLSDKLEKTNIAYAMAKINGIVMCQMYNKQYGDNFISVMPSNLYGTGDRYNFERGHVLAALIMKVYDAKINNKKSITIWGSGKPLREFLYIDDLIEGMLFLMKRYNDPEIINIGSGEDVPITLLADMIMEAMGYTCNRKYDFSKPDGTFRKLLDTTKINKLGWKPKINLLKGLKLAIENYIKLLPQQEISMKKLD